MDAISDPAVTRVVVAKGSQVGYTECLGNIIGFHIDQDPAPILVVQPTVEMAEAWSKDRLAPMITRHAVSGRQGAVAIDARQRQHAAAEGVHRRPAGDRRRQQSRGTGFASGAHRRRRRSRSLPGVCRQ